MDEFRDVSLKELFECIFKRLWIVATAVIFFCAAAFIITKFVINPQYSATIRLYANNKTEASSLLTSSDLSAAKSLVDTYITIIKSNSVIDLIAQESDLEYTPDQIKGMISAKSINGTEVFDVSVTGTIPEECAEIANKIAEFAPGKISEIVNGSSVKIIDTAKVPTGPISPSLSKNVMIAFLLGLVISCVTIIIAYLFDTTIYGEDDIKEICTLPILGVFPDLNQANRNGYEYTNGGGRMEG